MNVDIEALRLGLSNVYWLSGMTTSGKSTTAKILAEHHGLTVQARDDYIASHWERITPAEFPAMCYMKESLDGSEQHWQEFVEETTAESVERLWKVAEEDFRLTIEDLWTSLSEICDSKRPLLIEGARFLPEGLTPLLSDRRRAVWLAPSREVFEKRLQTSYKETWERFTDPSDGRRRLRDLFYSASEKVAESARDLGIAVIRTEVVDTPEIIATRVARVYGL